VRLAQVVSNLLINAAKFTPDPGAVRLRLAAHEGTAEVVVSDEGVGIDDALLPHVFDLFVQAAQPIDRRGGGLGLGLAIVRHLIELHGGSVSAHSEGEGLGATFLVSLPVSAVRYGGPLPAGGADGGAHSGPRSARLKGLRVLVVDDDADSRELLVRVLADRGAEVHCAANVTQALDIASRTAPRVLVSDIGMPGSDGYALIQLLRERGFSAKELPAIAVSGLARAEDRQQGMDAGYDFYFAKPVDVEGIVEAVAAVTERQTIQG
jgi:CheY-like chemotaxis protein